MAPTKKYVANEIGKKKKKMIALEVKKEIIDKDDIVRFYNIYVDNLQD